MATDTWMLSTVLAALVAVAPSAFAQDEATPEASPEAVSDSGSDAEAKNAVYVTLLGPGGVYSVDYDRLVSRDLALHVGLSYLQATARATVGGSQTEARSTLVSVPLTASYIGVGGPSHKLEVGGGATMVYGSGTMSVDGSSVATSGVGVAGTVIVGYRLQPADGGFCLRVGASPLFGDGFLPWGYLSMGGAFR